MEILVYAHWVGMSEPMLMGRLSAQHGKSRNVFSFAYDPEWLRSKDRLLLDPDLLWYTGRQYPSKKENFGLFMDSMPDTWGRTLMQRKAAIKAMEEGKRAPVLNDVDFLLGVNDEGRMGALRFKLASDGPFLNNDNEFPVPPWSSVRELQHASRLIESDADSAELKKWLALLLAPGSSLGGARPKANILDNRNHLWIAKFPSRNDVVNKGLWEFLAYRMALEAGISMSESKVEKVSGPHHTFFTKRFDRAQNERIHFASAMTMTSKNEEFIRDNPSSYLELAEFIQFSGSQIQQDLHQLWRRIVFNIAISNTDDHLRNHGFILDKRGWRLSPAYDINPSIDKAGLALTIDSLNNTLDFDLAKSVGEFFQLQEGPMNETIGQIRAVVRNWKSIAKDIGITRAEQELMAGAFRY